MAEPEKTLLTSAAEAKEVLQRLGKNLNGYFGETIDIDAVLPDCVAAGRTHGWMVEEISAAPKPSLLALTRSGSTNVPLKPKVYISTGIHGDEPAGPLAARRLLQENEWPQEIDLRLLPCLNPSGFRLNRRENDEGTDLNRQYLQLTGSMDRDVWAKRGAKRKSRQVGPLVAAPSKDVLSPLVAP